MTTEADITGRPPVFKPRPEPEEVQIPVEELCRPLSAKVMSRLSLARSDGYNGAMKSQRQQVRRY